MRTREPLSGLGDLQSRAFSHSATYPLQSKVAVSASGQSHFYGPSRVGSQYQALWHKRLNLLWLLGQELKLSACHFERRRAFSAPREISL